MDYKEMKKLADSGNVDALVNYAEALLLGKINGTPNLKEGLLYYYRAAEAGSAKAQFELGRMYQRSDEYESALEMFEKAAKQDHRGAQAALSVLLLMYFKDEKGAFLWATKAYNAGEKVSSPFILALIHSSGVVAKKDNDLIMKYLKIAAENGNEQAKEILYS